MHAYLTMDAKAPSALQKCNDITAFLASLGSFCWASFTQQCHHHFPFMLPCISFPSYERLVMLHHIFLHCIIVLFGTIKLDLKTQIILNETQNFLLKSPFVIARLNRTYWQQFDSHSYQSAFSFLVFIELALLNVL